MYLKITGIVLIMMSASLMGYLFSKDYIERINRLEQIQKMLILLKGKLVIAIILFRKLWKIYRK